MNIHNMQVTAKKIGQEENVDYDGEYLQFD